MPYTFGNLKSDLRLILFPNRESENLVKAHDKFFVDCLVELQQVVECLQQDNTDLFPQCATLYNCGLTVFDAPRGIIKAVGVIDKIDPATGDESADVPDDYCAYIPYAEVDFCHVRRYLDGFHHGGCCHSPFLFFGCHHRRYPTPTDDGLPAGLPPLPLGFHYPQASTNRSWGRAGGGIWAKDRGKIYIAPWIQTTETVDVKWDGIKRVWGDDDPIDDDPLLSKAVEAYVRWKHTEKFDHEFADAAAAKSEFEETRALLIRQCREETRARECESSLARSSAARVVTLYYNDLQTVTVNCPEGQTGDPVTVTIPSGAVGSSVSKQDANQRALDQAQTQAEAMLNCTAQPQTWTNTQQQATVSCFNDPDAPTPSGEPVTKIVPAGTVTSAISQADADAQALALAQTQAAAELVCTYWNRAKTYTATCPNDPTITFTATIPASTISSQISQADADNQALLAATNQAETGLNCPSGSVFWNTPQVIDHTRVCGPNRTLRIIVQVAAHMTASVVDQTTANLQARAVGEQYCQDLLMHGCWQGLTGTQTVSLP